MGSTVADTLHREAERLIGIPFEYGGRDFRPVVGRTDCLGICLEFLRRIGIEAPDPWEAILATWDRQGPPPEFEELAPAGWQPCAPRDQRRLGDVGETIDGTHITVYVGGGYELHAHHTGPSCLVLHGKVPIARWWRWQA